MIKYEIMRLLRQIIGGWITAFLITVIPPAIVWNYLKSSSEMNWIWVLLTFNISLLIAVWINMYIGIRSNRIRINMFHWIYNDRFDKLKPHVLSGEKDGIENYYGFYGMEELKSVIDKIEKKYHNMGRKEILELLRPHYKDLIENHYDKLIDEYPK